MRLIIRSSLIISGVLLLITTIGGYLLRQEPSTAFWIVGQYGTSDEISYRLTTPNGGVQHDAFQATPNNRLDMLGWLPNSQKLLYIWYTADEDYQLRLFDLQSAATRTLLTGHYSGDTQGYRKLLYVPNNEWVVLPLRNPQGAAYFRLSRDATTLERITPYYGDVDPFNFYLTPNHEWLYFEAAPINGPQKSLFRQHFDGTQRTKLMEYEGSAWIGESPRQDVYVNIVSNDPVSTEIYRIDSEGTEPQTIFSEQSNLAMLPFLDSNWLVLRNWGTIREIQYYRLRTDGSDFSKFLELFGLWQHSAVLSDGIYFEQSGASFHVIDFLRFHDRELISNGRLDDIRRVQPSANQRNLIIEGEIADRSVLYRVNRDGSDLRQIVDVGEREIEQLVTHVDPEWLLVAFDRGTPRQPRITYYRINVNTGEMDELFVIPTRTTRIDWRYGSDGDTIIFTESRSGGDEIANQYAVRLSDGHVSKGDFGKDLLFSPILDTDWHTDTLLIVALVLLITAFFPYYKK